MPTWSLSRPISAQLGERTAVVPRGFAGAARDAAEDRALGLNDICSGYEAMADLWQAYAEAIRESDQDPFSIQELEAVMVFIRRARLSRAGRNQHSPGYGR